MNGKELILNTFQHKENPRVPWVPYAGIHAGKLKGYTATEVLTDASKLYESLMEVHRLYMPDGMPICFDLQIEAEILGCELMWAENNSPSVASHPLSNTNEIPAKLVEKTDGRIPVVLEATKRIKESIGDTTALYGLFCGPFTLASHLRGTNLFIDMRKNPEQVKKLIDYCTENSLRMIDYYAENQVDVIASVDPLVSQISPKSFHELLHEPYQRINEKIREKNIFSSFFVCGNAIHVIDAMCDTNPDGISVDENVPMATAKEITDRHNIVIGGNIPVTTTMLLGSPEDNVKFITDMIASVDAKNLILSPGCDMPYDISVENTVAIAKAIHGMGD